MAPLPSHNTGRIYVDYSDGIHPHTMSLRYPASGSASQALTAAAQLLGALAEDSYLITIAGSRFSVAGSDVTNPIDWTGDATYGEGAMPAVNAPRMVSFVWKSIDGRRGRVEYFGIDTPTPGTYRRYELEATWVGPAIATLESASAADYICGISGLAIVLNQYANISFARYWQEEARP